MKFLVEDLYRVFGDLEIAYESFPHETQVRSQNGRLYYLGRGGLVQVDNKMTHSLDDFGFAALHLNSLVEWLASQWDSTVEADVKVHDRFLTFVTENGTAKYMFAVPLNFDEETSYDDIEEVIMRPLLSNKYSFEVPKDVNLAALLHTQSETSPTVPRLRVAIHGNACSLSSEEVTQSRILFNFEAESYPDEWVNTYSLEPFSLIRYMSDSAVTFSFTANEKAELSPLMITKEDTIVVMVPLWE